jgi:basic membrane protein A
MKNLLFLFGFCLVLTGCGKDNAQWRPGTPLPREKLVIGVIHISDPLNESSGYAFEHDRGIREMRENLGIKEEQIIRKINVSDADLMGVENALRDCIALGANVIFATSYGYMETNDGGIIGKKEETLSDSEIIENIHWYYRNVVEL